MRAVRVDDREDEDVELVDVLLRRRVGRVVANEPLRGLEARDRRHPLAGVLLAVEEDADRVVAPVLADPVHLLVERAPLDVPRIGPDEGRGRSGDIAGPVHRAAAQAVAQPHLRARERRPIRRAGHDLVRPGRRRRDDPLARVARVRERRDECAGSRIGVDRGDDLRRRARGRAVSARGEVDDDVLDGDGDLADAVAGIRVVRVMLAPGAVGHRDRERRVRHAGVLELGRDVVAALVAHAFENSCTANGVLAAFGLLVEAVVPAITAMPARW